MSANVPWVKIKYTDLETNRILELDTGVDDEELKDMSGNLCRVVFAESCKMLEDEFNKNSECTRKRF